MDNNDMMNKKYKVLSLIKSSISHDEFSEDNDSIFIRVDRYRRHDHR